MFRSGDLVLKRAPSLEGEAARLEWMREQGLPVPTVVESGPDFIVMSAMPGVDAAQSTAPPTVIVSTLAEGLRRLHAVPIDACPFDRTLAVAMAEARECTRLGLVDEHDFDEQRLGRSAPELLAELVDQRPNSEDIVFAHGDYCLPNVFVNPLGFVDCGRAGKADRYQDLALAARSVAYNLGPEWVRPLWQAYGVETPDPARLAFYTLLDEFF